MLKGQKAKCGHCGQIGHNATSCKNDPKPAKKPNRPEQYKRGVSGRFVKGTRGNPGGRTREQTQARNRLRDYILGKIEIGDANLVIDRLLELLYAEPRDAINAAQTLLEYSYGKPPTVAEIGGIDGQPIEISEVRQQIVDTVDRIAATIEAETDLILPN